MNLDLHRADSEIDSRSCQEFRPVRLKLKALQKLILNSSDDTSIVVNKKKLVEANRFLTRIIVALTYFKKRSLRLGNEAKTIEDILVANLFFP